jgi:uncharacterized protein YukE
MSNAVSNNTIGMRDWSKNIDSQADSYDELIRKLYTLVDQFANSEDFRGSLSKEFENAVLNQRQMFDSYSDTFRQCTEYMNRTASRIDAENDELAARMRSGNAV